MILSQNLRKGTVYLQNNEPLQVLDYSHQKMARGGATIRVKVKNLLSGAIVEHSYNSSEKFNEADLNNVNMQYLYSDENNVFVMDPTTYEQKSFSNSSVKALLQFLVEGETYQFVLFNDDLVNIILPKNISYTVEYTEPGFKGDTASNTLKKAKLSNGLEVMVPLFIKIGDRVKINTETGEYREREKTN